MLKSQLRENARKFLPVILISTLGASILTGCDGDSPATKTTITDLAKSDCSDTTTKFEVKGSIQKTDEQLTSTTTVYYDPVSKLPKPSIVFIRISTYALREVDASTDATLSVIDKQSGIVGTPLPVVPAPESHNYNGNVTIEGTMQKSEDACVLVPSEITQ